MSVGFPENDAELPQLIDSNNLIEVASALLMNDFSIRRRTVIGIDLPNEPVILGSNEKRDHVHLIVHEDLFNDHVLIITALVLNPLLGSCILIYVFLLTLKP